MRTSISHEISLRTKKDAIIEKSTSRLMAKAYVYINAEIVYSPN